MIPIQGVMSRIERPFLTLKVKGSWKLFPTFPTLILLYVICTFKVIRHSYSHKYYVFHKRVSYGSQI